MPRNARHVISEAAIRTAIYPMVRLLWRTRLDPAGLQEIPGPCFLYGNHSNNMDPFLVNWFARYGDISSGVLTAEYMKGGLVTAAFRGIGLLSTRKRIPEPHLIGQMRRQLRDGRKIMIYPEGGRRWAGRPAPWMESTAKVFQRFGFPVYPVVTHGSYVGWPRWATWPRPARIRVEVLPPLHLDRKASLESTLAQLQQPIAGDENVAPEDVRPRWAFRPADGIQRLLYRDPVTGENGGLHTPDGERIVNIDGSISWRMLPDSRIEDLRTGEVLLTGDLYESIRSLPLQASTDAPFLSNHVRCASGGALSELTGLGFGTAELWPDRVVVSTGADRIVCPLESLLYSGIERNRKLQLTDAKRLVELTFELNGSALQWDDTLRRLNPAIG